MVLLNECFNVTKSGVEILIIPAFACLLASQQNLDILYQRCNILLIFLKQFLYFLFGGRSKIFICYGHFYGPLQSLLLFIEMSSLFYLWCKFFLTCCHSDLGRATCNHLQDHFIILIQLFFKIFLSCKELVTSLWNYWQVTLIGTVLHFSLNYLLCPRLGAWGMRFLLLNLCVDWPWPGESFHCVCK